MYSEDFTRQVLSALEKGHSVRRVATDFGVNPGTIQNWKKTINVGAWTLLPMNCLTASASGA